MKISSVFFFLKCDDNRQYYSNQNNVVGFYSNILQKDSEKLTRFMKNVDRFQQVMTLNCNVFRDRKNEIIEIKHI